MTLAYLDGVERYWTGVVEAERKVGDQAQIQAVGQLLNTHANLTEEAVKASLFATRGLIPA